jgi:hypothetical protein
VARPFLALETSGKVSMLQSKGMLYNLETHYDKGCYTIRENPKEKHLRKS